VLHLELQPPLSKHVRQGVAGARQPTDLDGCDPASSVKKTGAG